ncbi:MAG TPA: ATP-binding protein [Geothermobacteraceae bacterium]|nr:ATP-binding protein [Geothermobacteraceae bacterium]
MYKIPFLRNILLISLALVVLMPLFDLMYLYPSYRNLLTERIENESVRFVHYLLRTLELKGQPLSRAMLPEKISHEAKVIMGDALVVKLRVFSPAGEIIYSTQADEIGEVNDKRYFHQIVARGNRYSKVVKKNQPTAEGILVARDVVETYVPVMTRSGFGGAMEVYYDVTESRQEIEQLTRNSSLVLIALCLGMLGLVILALRKARLSFAEQIKAETALQVAKDELEIKVQERTDQLLTSNQQLKDEISEKTLTQMALRSALADSQAAREKIDAILQSVTDGLLVVDRDLNIALVNPVVKQLFKIADREIVGECLQDAFGQDESSARLRRAFVERTKFPEFDMQIDGKVYLVRLSPVFNEQRQEVATIMLLQDVTQTRELHQLKSDFLAMAAHELHTPITAIMGYSELLGKGHVEQFSAEQKQEFIDIIYQKAEALANVVDDLLDISRMEAGQLLSLHFSRFALKDELEQQLEVYRRDYSKHSFNTDAVAAGLYLSADLPRFRQLLQNLLSNAIKYSPAGGHIRVAADLDGEEVCLSVTDCGIGMSPEQASQAFERFYRADTSNTAVSGTGLGLSIVRNIIQAHGGKVWIDSQPGFGTTVFCRFPDHTAVS